MKYFPKDMGLKVPHIGWNDVDFHGAQSKIEQFYFVHSLYTECSDSNDVAATTDYGIRFASAIRKGNLWATQFHPEKSGEVGLNLLRSFLEC